MWAKPVRGSAGRAPAAPALALAVAAIALFASACGSAKASIAAPLRHPVTTPATSAPSTTTTTTSPGEGSTLVIEARTEARLTDNFNPFSTTSALSQMGVPSYIYEPLLQYNELQVDQYYPWLAQSWSFSSSGLTVTFDLRSGVKWDDGSSFTATDVAYTFNLLKQDPAINDGIPIVAAAATSSTTFTLTLSQPGYAYLYDIARVPIVKSGFAAGANPATYVVTTPDGTGPYELTGPSGFSSKQVVLTARPGYWQSDEPSVHELVFPAYPGDAAVLSALQAGDLDWAAGQLPDVQAEYVDKDQQLNHYWGPPVDSIALELNLARTALDELPVRRAISDAIDRQALSERTFGGYDPAVTSASGLVLPTDSQYLVRSDTGDIDDNGDRAAVAQLMEAAGFETGPGGYWANAEGVPLVLDITDPRGSAFASAAAVVAQQLRAAGFDAAYGPVSTAQWRSDLADGHFGATVMASASGPSPYYMYEQWLDPARVVDGRAVGGDYERLDHATTPALAATVSDELDDFTDSLSDSSGARSAIQALAHLVAQQLPVIPLVYGVAWGEFSTRHVTGWPTSQDPYEPATPKAPFAEYTVLQLTANSR